MNVVLFEDDLVLKLYPMAVGRPAFEISCGSYRLLDLVGRLGDSVTALVRPHLRDVMTADNPELARGVPDREGTLLLVNARLVPTAGVLHDLKRLITEGRHGTVRSGESLAAALVDVRDLALTENLAAGELTSQVEQLPLESIDLELPLLDYPHDVIRHHQTALAENLADRLATGDYGEIADGVFAAPGAVLGQYVVSDTTDGPIVLDRDANIGPYCYLSGPAYIGPHARVIEHAAIKDGVALGHTTKIGGEIEASIIEPYTNKQHHGFMGHSYLGSWVNLGAGTCNSDLKNTYGQVGMEYAGRKVTTGMQFIGCIIGDYAKTAVNTSIFTGKTIGACAMVYGFVTTNVPSFVNYARSFGQVTEVPVDVMIATQARMFERRGVKQRPCDVQLLRDMYDLTRHERQLAEKPLSW
ncbi:MAG TPA: putative sugar nucleotidyl transferase [Thermoguttaceae bacterium]|nr:putative sugar nucleotidyl transferase [Thermoguttaceae bacterium]